MSGKVLLSCLIALSILTGCSDYRVGCTSDGDIYRQMQGGVNNAEVISTDTQVCKNNSDGSITISNYKGSE
jgi:hypothetical protein